MLLPKRFYEFNYNPVLQGYRERAGHHDHWSGLLLYHVTHALDRMKERYNVSVTAQDWERLNWAIFRETSDAKFLFVKSPDTTLYEIEYRPFHQGRTRKLNVMFSETAYCITTAVPPADVRLLAAERGEMKDIKHTYSPLLKARYDQLLTYQNRKYGYNHGRGGGQALADA
jgi:hypothetical protein